MGHVALLGDSIFDNAAYVAGGPAVVDQLREALGAGWQASLLAIDGSMIADIKYQLERLPAGTTHVVVSIGGNDALDHAPIVEQPAATVGEVLAGLAEFRSEFGKRHLAMLEAVRATELPAAVCTIYDGNFAQPLATLLETALCVFNDAITRNAFALGLDLIDLRLVCTEPADYANPIEPAVQGGAKIAQAVTRVVRATPQVPPISRVFA